MMNVPSASKLAPSMTFERLVCHQDVAFVICVTPQDVTPILLLAGLHLYSWPESAVRHQRIASSDQVGGNVECLTLRLP